MQKNVTIASLAKELGLSQSAVSKALNDYPDISPETKQLVRSKADELGYSPNMIARNLAKRTSNFVGFVIDDMASIYGEMFKSLNTVARRHGLNLILYETNRDPSIETACIQSLIDIMAMGIVVAPVSENIDQIEKITRNRVPVVYLGEKVFKDTVNYVCSYSAVGTELAMRHLISKGHRRIAMLCDQKSSVSQSRKIQTYQDFMRSIWQQEQVFYADAQNCHMTDAGYQLGKKLLASRAGYTALLAANDQLAIGVMGALKEAGIRIPEQIAVTGCDGIDVSALPLIGLTTVAQPRMKTAEIIIDILRRHAANPDTAAEHHLIKPELIIRNSTSLR